VSASIWKLNRKHRSAVSNLPLDWRLAVVTGPVSAPVSMHIVLSTNGRAGASSGPSPRPKIVWASFVSRALHTHATFSIGAQLRGIGLFRTSGPSPTKRGAMQIADLKTFQLSFLAHVFELSYNFHTPYKKYIYYYIHGLRFHNTILVRGVDKDTPIYDAQFFTVQ
jgi:hypothetical protein